MDTSDRAARLKRLFGLEIARIVRHMEERREFLVTTWSRARAREPFVETLFNRYRTVAASDLILLDLPELEAVEAFYEAVDEVGMYFRYTDDMPVMLGDRYVEHQERLAARAEEALVALGGGGGGD